MHYILLTINKIIIFKDKIAYFLLFLNKIKINNEK